MIRTPAYAGALLLALSACVAPPAKAPVAAAAVVEAAPAEPAAPQPAAPEPAVIEQPEPPVAEPEPPIEAETEAIIEAAIAALTQPEPEPEPEPPVAAAAPEIDDDPEQLMGLAGGALANLLGEPGFMRQDADAQIWQYRGNDCMLDVYLYRDGEDTPHRVTYYEFRGDGEHRPCFRSLLLAQAD